MTVRQKNLADVFLMQLFVWYLICFNVDLVVLELICKIQTLFTGKSFEIVCWAESPMIGNVGELLMFRRKRDCIFCLESYKRAFSLVFRHTGYGRIYNSAHFPHSITDNVMPKINKTAVFHWYFLVDEPRKSSPRSELTPTAQRENAEDLA